MINMNLSALIAALDATCRDSLEGAAAMCVSCGGHEISIEDYLEKLLDTREMRDLAAQFELSIENLRSLLSRRSSEKNSGRTAPVFSPPADRVPPRGISAGQSGTGPRER